MTTIFFVCGRSPGNCVKHWHEIWPNDEDLGLRVIDDECNLWWGEAEVDVNADGVQHRAAVEHLKVLDRVLVEEGDTVLVANTSSLQCLSDLRRALVELLPGLHAVTLYESDFA